MLKLPQFLIFILFFSCQSPECSSQKKTAENLRLVASSEITTGAMQTELYLPSLTGRSVGVVCNQTSVIGKTHLIDTLIRKGIDIQAIFSPEHGFRGEAEAGATVSSDIDLSTGIPVISLYGDTKKPSQEDLDGLDIVLFDIQDVGVRFYTYISTLSLVMEACAEAAIPVLVLDRPNPNGFYIDGPVLDTAFRSFVGMHPVPVVYGMSIGEYALMVNGEGWLQNKIQCDLEVVPLKGYERNMLVRLPEKPSPNLPPWQSIYLYPSLCLFEGTVVSVGRGTDFPFEVIGHPDLNTGSFQFTPRKIPGVAENPPFMGKSCSGQNLREVAESYSKNAHHFTLEYLLNYHRQLGMSHSFFNSYFDKLAGNGTLRIQIRDGVPEEVIRDSWKSGLERFNSIRKKYLLYPDF